MENNVRPTIQKIKLQEQDNKIKLREIREYNAAIASINRAIHDTSINLEKLTKEYESLIATTDRLEQQLIVERIRQSALSDQVDACRKELDECRSNSIRSISSVWEERTKLFETIHRLSDKCDIWALLTKPTWEITPNLIQAQIHEETVLDDTKLQAALERKNKVVAVRNSLLNEPQVGEEFTRTRNAIQFSIEMMASENSN